MGAIFGGWNTHAKPFSSEEINKAETTTAWWQPDAKFTYHDASIFLGQQDFYNHTFTNLEDKALLQHSSGLKIVGVTRLDNRKELLKLLGDQETNTRSNSEIILSLYLKLGIAALDHLVGSFAFSIWNPKEQELICVRDQMGTQPLSFYFHDGVFLFGSQKKSILALDGINKEPNWRNILNRMCRLAPPKNSSEVKHIQYLEPGHYIRIKSGKLEIKQYWELDINKVTTYQDKDQYVERFKELFDQAVGDRMDSVQGLGAHLSGGLDSSGIAGVAHNLAIKGSGAPVHLLSYNLPDDFDGNPDLFEENLKAFDMVKYLKSEHFVNVNTPYIRDYQRLIRDEVLISDGISQSNNVNTEFDLQHRAHQLGINVMLSGFPGDELVTSFCRPYYLEYFEQKKYLSFFTKNMNTRHGFKDKLYAFGGATLSSLSSGLSSKIVDYYHSRNFDRENYILKKKVVNSAYFDKYPELAEPEFYPRAHHDFPTSFRAYQRNHLCREHTTQRIAGEKLSGLRWKVDYRYPMLDIRLTQYMLSIPMEQKISPDMNRRIFRLGMKDVIPESIRLRDQKNKGSLKPMSQFVKLPEDKSYLDFWNEVKENRAAPFLDTEIIDKFMVNKKRAFMLNKWMIIAEMGMKSKLEF